MKYSMVHLKNFINIMKNKNYNFDTQKDKWSIKMKDLNQLVLNLIIKKILKMMIFMYQK